MASILPLLFLSLLLLLLLPLSLSLSTAPTQPPTTPPPSPPPHRIHRPPSLHHPPPPSLQNHNNFPTAPTQPPRTPPSPPPPNPRNDDSNSNIIDAIIGSGDFGNWINLLMTAHSNSSTTATLFIPDDVSLPQPNTPNPTSPNQLSFDPFLFAYHVVPRRLSFSDLLSLPLLSRLPTLLPSNSLLLTNTSRLNFTLNHSPITHPDLYLTPAVSIHGIAQPFDYRNFGTPPPPPPRSIRRPPPPPTYRRREDDPGFTFLPREIADSGASRFSSGFLISVASVFGGVMIL